MPLPPARYRVEERGRRLVTIDTRTGQEYGADISHARAQERDAGGVKGPAPDRAKPAETVQGQGKPGVAGKLVVLAMGTLLLIAFLIMTNLWFLAVIPLAIPQVRTVVLTRGKAMLRKYLDQAATG
jgi:hypothetical protein